MSVDTLTLARELRDATLPPEHAEAIAAAIGKSISDGSATKADIELMLARLDNFENKVMAQFESLDAKHALQGDALESRLTAKIEAVRSSVLVWLVGVVIAAGSLFITISKLFYS